MYFNGRHIISTFTNFELDSFAEIITFSQRNRIKIKREYNKLSNFYKNNPDLLLSSLHETREFLEEKRFITELTEFEELSLKEIYNLLDNQVEIKDMFQFNEDFLLDDYKKVVRQIEKKNPEFLEENKMVDIIYYDFFENKESGVALGEFYKDGNINTGSQIILKIIKVDHSDMFSKYQTLFN